MYPQVRWYIDGGEEMMDVLVMLEDRPDSAVTFAEVHSVPSPLTAEAPQRRVVTMYGEASPESLAHALAAAVDGHRGDVRVVWR